MTTTSTKSLMQVREKYNTTITLSLAPWCGCFEAKETEQFPFMVVYDALSAVNKGMRENAIRIYGINPTHLR